MYVVAKRIALLLIIFGLVGCGWQTVRENIGEKEAHEIVAVLNRYGVPSIVESTRGRQGSYAVKVRRGAFLEAAGILVEHGVPGEQRESFRDLTTQRGFLPNSHSVEMLRVDRALAAEIEEALENLPQVIQARVIVRYKLMPEGVPPGVSVVLRYKEGGSIEEESVRLVIAEVIPGVDPANIKMILSTEPEEPIRHGLEGKYRQGDQTISVPLVPLLFWRVREGDQHGMVVILLLVSIGMLGSGIVIGYVWFWSRTARREERQNQDEEDSLFPQERGGRGLLGG